MIHITAKKVFYKLSIVYIVLVVLCAIFSEWLCNEMPLITSYNHSWYITTYNFRSNDRGIPILKAPIPFSPNTQDPKAVHSLSPLEGCRYSHYLGTDELGHDILCHIIYGCRTASLVGIIAVVMACLIGLIIGICAGYWGDSTLFVPSYYFYSAIVSALPIWFYSWHIRAPVICNAFKMSFASGCMSVLTSLLILTEIACISSIVMRYISKLYKIKKRIRIPLDSILSRGMDVFLSLPLFYLALLVFTLIKTVNVVHIAVLIGLTSWVSYARLVRVEALRLKVQPFIEASLTGGLPIFKLMYKHILPNILSPVLVAIVFGMANAIIAESAFSAVGMMSVDHVSWGTILSDARHTPNAWWLSVFPGLMLTLLMLSLYTIGSSYRRGKITNDILL